jgi:putative iron-regulated protein
MNPTNPCSPHSAIVWAIATGMLLSLASCSTSTPTAVAPESKKSATAKFDPQILRDFTSKVVIPTNQLFASRAQEMSKAIDTFTKTPNEETLKAAQAAWVAARAPWEQTECFGFGPAESLGYDGSLDTWPVNATDLQGILKSNDKLSAEAIGKMKETEKGFHVMEYMLFGEGKTRKAKELSGRELKLLALLGADFAKVANNLADAWTKGVEGKPPYQSVLATAGQSGNTTYPTIEAGAQQIVEGMLDSLGEVADTKIGKTAEAQDPQLAESRFSLNTLTDIKHNVQGSRNVYLGSFPDAKTSGMGIGSYVAQVNPALDAKIKEQFAAATTALNKIPGPFEQAIANPQAATSIKEAKAAVEAVHETIEKEVKPLIIKS